MAKQKKEIKGKTIEVTLWEAANKLRGSVEPAEYKHVVLGLIFLKFASDKFEEHRAKLIADGKEKYIEMPEFYNMNNVFFLEETSRWSYLIKRAKQNDIALLIDTALHTIEKNNKALKGALPDNYFSRLGLDVTKLASLLDTINDIDTTKDPKQDVVGKVYEYFLSKFALAEGKGKGEFYTPKSIVNLIAEMIEPYKGIIYDPACGSGGMFVQSIKFIEAHHGNKKVGDETRQYRNREKEILFMDLRQMGEPFEKKYTQFSDDDIQKVVNTYHQWQTKEIENVPEFCYSASLDEVAKKDFSLVPSKYIEFVNRDENIDFDEKMQTLKNEFAELLKAEAQSKNDLLSVFKELGYEIKL
jgi:type I restriction enzyme M protein